MRIKGLQKLTLIDYPGKFACTIFLWGCNFRCGFCHNPELVVEEEEVNFTQREVLDFLEKRKGLLEGVCITGGEPLMTLDKDFVREIKNLGYMVKIDTNGCFPERLREFIDEGLVDFVAMDVKNCQEKYSETAGAEVDLKKIEDSIKIISLLENYEFRTTVLENLHSKENLVGMVKWINETTEKKPKKFALQGFKNSGKFIGKDYLGVRSSGENFLNELKFLIKDYFDEIEVRK